MWEQTAPKVAVCPHLKSWQGEVSPIPPQGRWEKKFRVEFLTVIPHFLLRKNAKVLPLGKTILQCLKALMHIALIPPLIEVDIPAREEKAESYIYQVFQAIKNREKNFISFG